MIDTNHIKFSEYKGKFEKIRNEMAAELNKIEPSYGLDGKSTAICKKYAKKLKELQKEYSYLFKQ